MKSRRKKQSTPAEKNWDSLLAVSSSRLDVNKMAAAPPSIGQRRVFVREDVNETESEIIDILANLATSITSAAPSFMSLPPAQANGTFGLRPVNQQPQLPVHQHQIPVHQHQQTPVRHTERLPVGINNRGPHTNGSMKQHERVGPRSFANGSLANGNIDNVNLAKGNGVSAGAGPNPKPGAHQLSIGTQPSPIHQYLTSVPVPSRCCHPSVPDIFLHILDRQSAPLLEHLRQYAPYQTMMCPFHMSRFHSKTLIFLLDQAAAQGVPSFAPASIMTPVSSPSSSHNFKGLPYVVSDVEPPMKRQRIDGQGCESPYYDCAVLRTPESHAPPPHERAPQPQDSLLRFPAYAPLPQDYNPPQQEYAQLPPDHAAPANGHDPQLKDPTPPHQVYPHPPQTYGPFPQVHTSPYQAYPPLPHTYVPMPRDHAPPTKECAPRPQEHALRSPAYAPLPQAYVSSPQDHAPPQKAHHRHPQTKDYAPPPQGHTPPSRMYGLSPQAYIAPQHAQAYGLNVPREAPPTTFLQLDQARDQEFRLQVMQELQGKLAQTAGKTHGEVTGHLILRLLEVCESPSLGEALVLSGEDAAAQVEAGPAGCPIFTSGQQMFQWENKSRPIEEIFRRMENLNRTVSVQIPSRKPHQHSFSKKKLFECQQRFTANVDTDDPWNILDLRNPLPPTVMPKFLAGENCQVLPRVRDAVLSGSSAERTVAAKEKWNEWLDVLDWVLLSEAGHNTAPHMDSHGLSTWITIQEGQFGYGWLSKPTKEERDAWIADPQTFTGGRWRFTVLTPGKTVFFGSGTIHFVFRLRHGQTLGLGGHILQWTGLETWVTIMREQLKNSQITNEDVEWSAPKYLRVITDLVMNRIKSGRVAELGGQEAVDRYMGLVKEAENDIKQKEKDAKPPAKKKRKR